MIVSRLTPLCAATAQDGTEGAEPERVVAWDGDPLVRRFGCFQDDVAANLMYLCVLPATAQDIGEVRARDVARDLHATDKISSRTR